MSLGCFSLDIAFAHYFVAIGPPSAHSPIGVIVILATAVKNYLKWQAIQLAINSTVDEYVHT